MRQAFSSLLDSPSVSPDGGPTLVKLCSIGRTFLELEAAILDGDMIGARRRAYWIGIIGDHPQPEDFARRLVGLLREMPPAPLH